MTKEQADRMVDQCQRIMQTPQVQKLHQQMMQGQMMGAPTGMAPPASQSS